MATSSKSSSSEPRLAARKDWPTFTPNIDYIRPKTKKHKTILTVDGGGLRGMLPARLLEDLEVIIKVALVKRKVPGRLTMGQSVTAVPMDKKLEDLNLQFNIDLADYFDVMSGTSTGSIITAYLATKGELASEFLASDQAVDDLGKSERKFSTKFDDKRALQSRYSQEYLRPGSCRALQAVFAARAARIFPGGATGEEGGPWWNPLWLIKGVAQGFGGKVKAAIGAKYPAYGINETLKSSFGGVIIKKGEDSDELLKANKDDKKLSSGVLHTSLVIPAFHLDKTRTMVFYYKHNPYPDAGNGPAKGEANVPPYGYATLNRRVSKTERAFSAPLMQNLVDMSTPEIVLVPGVDFNLWEVVRSSTAAPTYFPSITLLPIIPQAWASTAEVEGEEDLNPASPAPWKLVDGGLTANNPGAAAITFATTAFKDVKSLEQLAVLSLGCGTTITPTDVNTNAGWLPWVAKLINCLMSGNQELASALMDHFISKNYTNDAGAKAPKSDRYVRIQKTIFTIPDENAKPKDFPIVAKTEVVGDNTITVGPVTKTVAALLTDMDYADSVLHYVKLGDAMLEEPAEVDGGGAIREKFQRFVDDYLVPDLSEPSA